MGAGGYIRVLMGALGSGGTGRTKKPRKTSKTGKTSTQNCIPTEGHKLQKKNNTTKLDKKISTDHQKAQKENGTQKYNKQKPPKQRNGRNSGKKPTKDEEVAPTRMATNYTKKTTPQK